MYLGQGGRAVCEGTHRDGKRAADGVTGGHWWWAGLWDERGIWKEGLEHEQV